MMAKKVALKVILLGERSCGKTALLERFLHDSFEHCLPKSKEGDVYTCKTVPVTGGGLVTLGIWDTSAGKKYEAMTRVYYQGAGAAIICFDLTSEKSFQKAKFWMKELKMSGEKCMMYLCGTKHDLLPWTDDVATSETNDAMAYANEMSAKYIETSAKTTHNVEKLFKMIAEDCSCGAKAAVPPKPKKKHVKKGPSHISRVVKACTVAYNKVMAVADYGL